MKKTLQRVFQTRAYKRAALRVAGPLVLLLAGLQSVQAQTTVFPRVESFKNGTANQFTLYGNATLTGTGATGADPQGDGYLRLTTADGFKAGTAIDESSFPAPQGFSISFDFFSYGGTGADGFSVYLIDGNTTAFRIGADGGSLGYAQRGATPGVSNGYIGIGIDEFGNYANPTEGRVGGTGFTYDAVSIRGAGNGNTTTDYPFIAGSGTLPFSLDVAAKRAQQGNADYRRAFIDFIPFTNSVGINSYKVTIRIQNGDNVTTALSNVVVPTPPPTLRIGFSGSTGGNTNVHEIRSLAVVKPTIANDDQFSTRYRQTVSYDVTSNDKADGSSLDKKTVDLNPNTATVDRTLVVPGKGTFTVDATTGVVTFEPLSTFAGVVTIPYTIRDILNTLSNQADITVTVTGADVAASISGPTTANPGSQVTYSTTMTNIGVETAINLIPTLLLPKNLVVISSPNYTYNATTGLVTFNQTTLVRNAAVTNSVAFTVPATGTASITGTAGYTYPAGAVVPDPVSTNNTASVTTTIGGIANVATVCATPGKDGFAALSATVVPNTYFPGVAVSTANGTSTLTVGAARTGAGTAATAVAVGDLVLLMQMQGADITTTNTTAYGTITGGAAYTAGRYEYAIVRSVAAGTGNNQVLTLVKSLTNSYATTTGTSPRTFQVLRVPQYSSVTLTGTISGATWDGSTGGVLALDVAGKTTYATSASLSMTGRGFRGGGGFLAATATPADYASSSTAGNGSKGESLAGTPAQVFDGGVVLITNTSYPTGSHAAGAPGNGGGGATDFSAANSGNSGGGGGSNGGTGGIGGYGFGSNSSGIQAQGGRDITADATPTRLFMGGGGGAGSATTGDIAMNSSGGVGGGIIILRSGPIATSGTGSLIVEANGGNAPTANAAVNTTSNLQGGGGGGAAGTVILMATNTDGTAATLTSVVINANGGGGGNAGYVSGNGANATLSSYGPGGGGSGGKYYANSALAVASSVAGGSAGTTQNGTNKNPVISSYGATAGAAGVASTTTAPMATATIAGAGACLPMLTAALSAAPNNVTRTTGNAVNPVIYTLTVSNTGGAATGVSASATLNNLFKYDNTYAPVVTLTLADGSTSTVTGYTAPANGTSTPVFSNITIPAGASLSIKFRATIASSAVDGVVYNSSSTVSYNNPMRTSVAATTTLSPGGNYASGTDTSLGTAAGSNYDGTLAANTSEDVTIVKALPVELIRFEVAAAGRDARLSWTTASEKNNAYFEVQRSLDGKQFETIGKRTGQGSTQARTNYAYLDADAGRLLAGQPIYYRLRQVDYDGQEAFSPVRVVTFGQAAKTAVALYPNPSAQHPTVTLDLTGLPTGNYQVQVLDLTGRLLQQQSLAGGQLQTLAVQSLPMGSYVVTVHGGAIHLNLKLVRD